jgi:uncharacterized protein with HEPN domain
MSEIDRELIRVKLKQVRWAVVAHNYFDIDDVLVFNNCRDHLPPLLKTVRLMIKDLKPNLG